MYHKVTCLFQSNLQSITLTSHTSTTTCINIPPNFGLWVWSVLTDLYVILYSIYLALLPSTCDDSLQLPLFISSMMPLVIISLSANIFLIHFILTIFIIMNIYYCHCTFAKIFSYFWWWVNVAIVKYRVVTKMIKFYYAVS